MKVYTKTGDGGETSLLSRQRIAKDDVRVEAYGTVDEANTAMGLAKSLLTLNWAESLLQTIQEELIALNGDLATEASSDQSLRIGEAHVARLERLIDELEEKRIPQESLEDGGAREAERFRQPINLVQDDQRDRDRDCLSIACRRGNNGRQLVEI